MKSKLFYVALALGSGVTTLAYAALKCPNVAENNIQPVQGKYLIIAYSVESNIVFGWKNLAAFSLPQGTRIKEIEKQSQESSITLECDYTLTMERDFKEEKKNILLQLSAIYYYPIEHPSLNVAKAIISGQKKDITLNGKAWEVIGVSQGQMNSVHNSHLMTVHTINGKLFYRTSFYLSNTNPAKFSLQTTDLF